MNWPQIKDFVDKTDKDLLIKIITNKGPIALENFIKKKFSYLGKFYLINHWSPYSKIGIIELIAEDRKIFIEWMATKEKDKIIDVRKIDNFDIEKFEEYLSSLGVESSVLRLMRSDF